MHFLPGNGKQQNVSLSVSTTSWRMDAASPHASTLTVPPVRHLFSPTSAKIVPQSKLSNCSRKRQFCAMPQLQLKSRKKEAKLLRRQVKLSRQVPTNRLLQAMQHQVPLSPVQRQVSKQVSFGVRTFIMQKDNQFLLRLWKAQPPDKMKKNKKKNHARLGSNVHCMWFLQMIERQHTRTL